MYTKLLVVVFVVVVVVVVVDSCLDLARLARTKAAMVYIHVHLYVIVGNM